MERTFRDVEIAAATGQNVLATDSRRKGAKRRLRCGERSITVEQAETLLGELPAHQRDVVLFALATGLRQSNVVGLEWSHVDLKTGHAWVSAGQSKNRRPIAMPLNATALEVLRRQSASTVLECLPMQGSRLEVPIRWHGERRSSVPASIISAGTI